MLTDSQIALLLAEPKRLGTRFDPTRDLRTKRGHRERDLAVSGDRGGRYQLIVRQATENAFDFSAILAYEVPGTNKLFRLRRFNSRTHQHTNRIEGNSFIDFHIHQATERYQALGLREDTFAEPTTRFSDISGAVDCLFEDCSFVEAEPRDPGLFD